MKKNQKFGKRFDTELDKALVLLPQLLSMVVGYYDSVKISHKLTNSYKLLCEVKEDTKKLSENQPEEAQVVLDGKTNLHGIKMKGKVKWL